MKVKKRWVRYVWPGESYPIRRQVAVYWASDIEPVVTQLQNEILALEREVAILKETQA